MPGVVTAQTPVGGGVSGPPGHSVIDPPLPPLPPASAPPLLVLDEELEDDVAPPAPPLPDEETEVVAPVDVEDETTPLAEVAWLESPPL